MNPFGVRCCGQEPRWVENVPGKGYLFCGECKNEVLQPLKVEVIIKLDSHNHVYSNIIGYGGIYQCINCGKPK